MRSPLSVCLQEDVLALPLLRTTENSIHRLPFVEQQIKSRCVFHSIFSSSCRWAITPPHSIGKFYHFQSETSIARGRNDGFHLNMHKSASTVSMHSHFNNKKPQSHRTANYRKPTKHTQHTNTAHSTLDPQIEAWKATG